MFIQLLVMPSHRYLLLPQFATASVGKSMFGSQIHLVSLKTQVGCGLGGINASRNCPQCSAITKRDAW